MGFFLYRVDYIGVNPYICKTKQNNMSYTKRYLEQFWSEEPFDMNEFDQQYDAQYEQYVKLEEEKAAYEQMLADKETFITLA